MNCDNEIQKRQFSPLKEKIAVGFNLLVIIINLFNTLFLINKSELFHLLYEIAIVIIQAVVSIFTVRIRWLIYVTFITIISIFIKYFIIKEITLTSLLLLIRYSNILILINLFIWFGDIKKVIIDEIQCSGVTEYIYLGFVLLATIMTFVFLLFPFIFDFIYIFQERIIWYLLWWYFYAVEINIVCFCAYFILDSIVFFVHKWWILNLILVFLSTACMILFQWMYFNLY